MKKWETLYNALPPDRRSKVESFVNGFKARVDKEPLDSRMADHDWRDGWHEADAAILGKWAADNNVGSKARVQP